MECTRAIGRARRGADGAGCIGRRYVRSSEPLSEAVAVRGISKSAESARLVHGTERKLAD